MKKSKQCECKLCVRGRNYKKYIDMIHDTKAKKFFDEIYSILFDVEEENEFLNMYQNNLKKMYPIIYNETHTIKPLNIMDVKHPEINI